MVSYGWFETGRKYSLTVSEKQVPVRGTFKENIITKTNYTHNSASSGYWWEKIGTASKYDSYKYDSNLKMLAKYDTETEEILTKQIDFSKLLDTCFIKVEANVKQYNCYISKDNTNWKEISKDSLDGEKEIILEGKSNKIYIKIKRNNSDISRIRVFEKEEPK